MRLAPVAVVVVAAVLLAGCGGGDGVAPPGTGATPGIASTTSTTAPPPPLAVADVRDRAYTADAGAVTGFDLVAGTELRFDFASRLLTVTAGCTTMTAPFELGGGRLSWSVAPVVAPADCPGERQLQDRWVVDQLVAGFEAEATEDGLRLRDDDGLEIDLVEQEADDPTDDAPLLGTTWRVETVVDGSTASAVPAEAAPPTLRLSGDGSVELFDGCDQASATVALEEGGEVLRFGELTSTSTACADAADELASAVRGVLDGATFAQVDGTTLTVTKGDAALVLRAS